MRPTIATIHEQVHDALSVDTVLNVLGFDHRHIGDAAGTGQPRLVLTWPGSVRGSRSALLAILRVEVSDVGVRTRDALLDRVGVVLASVPSVGGPIKRVRRDRNDPATFLVLAHRERPTAQHGDRQTAVG